MSGTISTKGGYVGSQWLQTGGTQYQSLDFMIRQIIAGKAFSALVQVKGVSGGGVDAPAIVSVQPTVNQVDGLGNQVPHGTIYNIPVFRPQGGSRAVIVDPVVGDIGVAVICDRDISAVKANKAVSGPGSARQNSWADGCYFGSFLGAAATTYLHLDGDDVRIKGGKVYIDGDIIHTGTITSNGKNIGSTHTHGGVQTGGGTTGGPT